jgi:hypothetical protein
MKLVIVSILSMIVLVCTGTAYACHVRDKEEYRMGQSKGFRGECSNNGSTITCVLEEGSWVKCYGPGGSSTGTVLNSLIFSVCRCSAQEEEREKMEEQMQVD